MAAPWDTPAAAEKDARIVEYRRQGFSFREIAKEMNHTVSWVYTCYQRGLRRIAAPAVSVYRDDQLARIQAARAVVENILLSYNVTVSNGRVFGDIEDHGPILAAVDRMIKLDEQEAKLLGLQAPTKVSVDAEVNYTVGGGVDPGAMT